LRAPVARFAEDLRDDVEADFAAERFVVLAPPFRLAAGFLAALERAPVFEVVDLPPRAVERPALFEPALLLRDAAGFFAAARLPPAADEPLRAVRVELLFVERLLAALFEVALLRAPVFFAEADRAAGRLAAAAPPFAPPLFDEAVVVFRPRPDPLFLPPPLSLLTVAQARRSASSSETPRVS
jgi:hypothetical protein